MLYNKTNNELLEDLDQAIYGHTEAKKSLINLVNRSKIRHRQKWGQLLHTDYLINTGKCLLIGGSGTGKTFLMQTLSRFVNFPYLVIDATQLNPNGAQGGIKVEDLKSKITATAKEYFRRGGETFFSINGIIDQMVVFVDEFDKLSSTHDGSSSGNWNTHVQENFLTLFDSDEEFSGVSWVFAGAFTGLRKQLNKKPAIGFNSSESVEAPNGVTDEAIIEYGIIPEMVGRLSSICVLDTLTKDDFYNILVNNLIPKKLNELSYFNINDLDITNDDLLRIASSAEKSSQGVRYLQRELDKYFFELEFNYEDSVQNM